ncbi:MAG: aldehyde reductase [Leptospiraceae bacterium]|nr:aldehyde reductase [Leptospiraceae bacterium]
MVDKKSPILVTGGSGYIASWIIKFLLDEGYSVHTTVRNVNDKTKYSHLIKLSEDSNGSLKIFEADLLVSGSFEEAMKGCELVMHTASPFFVTGIKDAEKQLVEPAKNGTKNVLFSANKLGTVKRIVLTSSCAAIYGDNKDIEKTEKKIFSENHWNITSNLENNPYSFSKTEAEKLAWEIEKEQSVWDLVTINPAFVLGPSLTKRTDSTSIDTMVRLCNGNFFPAVPELWMGIVDVRDVAKSHILSGLNEKASGRHILCADSLELLQISKILRNKYGGKYLFPLFHVPKFLVWMLAPFVGFTRDYIDKNMEIKVSFDNSYTKKDLGLEFTPLENTILDHFEQLLDDGIISRN